MPPCLSITSPPSLHIHNYFCILGLFSLSSTVSVWHYHIPSMPASSFCFQQSIGSAQKTIKLLLWGFSELPILHERELSYNSTLCMVRSWYIWYCTIHHSYNPLKWSGIQLVYGIPYAASLGLGLLYHMPPNIFVSLYLMPAMLWQDGHSFRSPKSLILDVEWIFLLWLCRTVP